MTFQPKSLILESHKHIKTYFYQKLPGQLNSNPYDMYVKMYTNCSCHMTEMAATPCMVKQNIFKK